MHARGPWPVALAPDARARVEGHFGRYADANRRRPNAMPSTIAPRLLAGLLALAAAAGFSLSELCALYLSRTMLSALTGGPLHDSLASVARFLPYDYYQSGEALGGLDWAPFLGLLAASAVLAMLAWWRFQRRDIRVAGEGGWRLPSLRFRRRYRTGQEA